MPTDREQQKLYAQRYMERGELEWLRSVNAEMLEALKEAAAHLRYGSSSSTSLYLILDKVHAAIAKAERQP